MVVPAHNAADLIGSCLRPLTGADVVVVDDASVDATGDIARSLGARVVRLDRRSGPAAARNAGIDSTGAPLIAFTDADCVPQPGWLEAMRAALDDHDLVQGPVLPQRPPGPFDRTVDVRGPSPRFETANLGVRRELIELAGRFEHPRFVDDGHFGEDAMFGWRAVRAGARRGFAREAVVLHAVFPRGPRGYIAEQKRLRYFPPLMREVPELRQGPFLSARTAAFDLAVVGVIAAMASRRAWPLALAAPYVRRRVYQPRRVWRRSVLRVNAALVAGDLVGLAALLRGSLNARRVVL